MSTARLRIEAAGPLTTVQDAGRPGWRRFGVPPSGPVDRRAFAAALAATGGQGAAIEVSLGGVTIVCEEAPVAIALTGAAIATVDGVEVGGWCVVTLQPGARCRVREQGGNWGYVAVAGTLEGAAWLGSRSTHLIAGLGAGRLEAGATLVVSGARGDLTSVAIHVPPGNEPITMARVVRPVYSTSSTMTKFDWNCMSKDQFTVSVTDQLLGSASLISTFAMARRLAFAQWFRGR